MLIEDTIRELKNIMMSLTVKYKHKGERIDTAETKFNANRYIAAVDKTDTFYSHTTYDVEAITRSGLTQDTIESLKYAVEPESIPKNYRAIVLEEQRKIIVRDFIELNPYFRMLNGQPPLTMDDHYANIEFYDAFGIEIKPVSKFTDTEVLHLEASGELNNMKNMYPDSNYLNFLGPYKIDPYKSRKAYHFEILRTNYSNDISLLDKFLTIYEENRSYVMSVLYISDFSKTKPYYDEFMALMLSVMTTQRLIVDVFKVGISRDFYDLNMIQALYESYNVPFIEELPLEYHNLICKNLNKLLHYKSTDKVIFDLLELLGFNRAQVFKYYLVKNHKLDVHGNPIFEYEYDSNGNLVENKDLMYDVHFVSVNIEEENEEFELSNPRNKMTYEEVTATDAFWWEEDSEVLRKIYDEEFNYINTKYMHVNIMYKLTEMIFEVIHVFKILKDNESQAQSIEIAVPKIINTRKISLFKFFIFMSAALCKFHNLKGEIITEHAQVAGLVGFDFKTDFIALRDYLNSKSDLIDSNTIMKYISNLEMIKLEDVDRIFSNVKALWEFLSDQMAKTDNYEVFKIYENLYKTLYVSDYMTDLFTMRSGKVASTYMEMLMDMDPELHSNLEYASADVLKTYIDHGIETLGNIYSSSKHLHLVLGDTSSLMDALLKLMRFFKSYTVDIRNFNIVYVFDHPYLHGIKLLDRFEHMEAEMDLPELEFLISDYISIVTKFSEQDKMHFHEYLSINGHINLHSKLLAAHELSIQSKLSIVESFKMIDLISIKSEMISKVDVEIIGILADIVQRIDFTTRLDILLKEAIESEIFVGDRDSFELALNLIESKLTLRDIWAIAEVVDMVSEILKSTDINIEDSYNLAVNLLSSTKVTMFDMLFNEAEILKSLNIKLVEDYQTVKTRTEIISTIYRDMLIHELETDSLDVIQTKDSVEIEGSTNVDGFILQSPRIARAIELLNGSMDMTVEDRNHLYSQSIFLNKVNMYDAAYDTFVRHLLDGDKIKIRENNIIKYFLSFDNRINFDDDFHNEVSLENSLETLLQSEDIKSFVKLLIESEKIVLKDDSIVEVLFEPKEVLTFDGKTFSDTSLNTAFKQILYDDNIIESGVSNDSIIRTKDTLTIVRESEQETY